MLNEAIAGFRRCMDDFAGAYPDAVGARHLETLGGLADSFGGFEQRCSGTQERVEQLAADALDAAGGDEERESRRRKLEAMCREFGWRLPTFPGDTDNSWTATEDSKLHERSSMSGFGMAGRETEGPGGSDREATASKAAAALDASRAASAELRGAVKEAEWLARLGVLLPKWLTALKRATERFRANAEKETPPVEMFGRMAAFCSDLEGKYRETRDKAQRLVEGLQLESLEQNRHELENILASLENLGKQAPGKSRMVEEWSRKVATALENIDKAVERAVPLADDCRATWRRAAKGVVAAAWRRSIFASGVSDEQRRQAELAWDGRAIPRLIGAITGALARLTGRPASEFAGDASAGGLPYRELVGTEAIPEILDRARASCRRRVESAGEAFRAGQRPLEEMSGENMNATGTFPDQLVWGTLESDILDGRTLSVPAAMEFPPSRPVRFRNASEIPGFLARLIYAVPPGKVRIAAVDYARYGDTMRALNDLGTRAGILKTIASPGDLAPALGEIEDEMGRIASTKLSATVRNWTDYNRAHPGAPLPLRVLAFFTFEGLDGYSRSFERIQKILENGPRFGVLCLVSDAAVEDLDEKQRAALDEIPMLRLPLDAAGTGLPRCRELAWKPVPEEPAGDERLGELAATYAGGLAKRAEKPVKTFSDLFAGEPFWGGDSTEGLSAPIGWDEEGRPVCFELGVGRGAAAFHALVGGTTGSGKSVWLHAMIQSMAGKYSPDELQLYLLDYKKGDEFKKYADEGGDAWLPHARMISRHKDPRFALELFDHLDAEFKRRSTQFGSYGDIVAFRRNGGKMPRILVVIDEFQVMFEEYGGLNLSEAVAARLSTVFKQGRAYGIHVVLATQSLRSLVFKGMGGILGQIGMRVALYGQKEDGILADNNDAATRLTPKRQCVVNPAFGARDSGDTVNNFVADVPFADPAQVPGCQDFRRRIEEEAARRGLHPECRVFNGAALPEPPGAEAAARALTPAKWNVEFRALLGARTDFASTPFAVDFTGASREHLLVAGEDGPLVDDPDVAITGEGVWEGIRRGLTGSLRGLESTAVLWYDPESPGRPEGLPDEFAALGGRASEAELLAALKDLAASGAERKVFVAENFQEARVLHPGEAPRPAFPGRAAPPPPETAHGFLASVFSGTDRPPFHAVLMTRNFGYLHRKVFARTGAEANILDACGKRIAFNLAPNVLEALVPDLSISDRRGPRRVWFEDVNTGKTTDFLPYAGELPRRGPRPDHSEPAEPGSAP
ncbi:MAG: hypothetical protein IK066_13005 [Kiritimatiellae bacterium]|nr:hypothetical protein [Kiritimatiellia bacterium]